MGHPEEWLMYEAYDQLGQGSEEEFCQPLGQARQPPDASSAIRQYYHTKVETLVYICTSGFSFFNHLQSTLTVLTVSKLTMFQATLR